MFTIEKGVPYFVTDFDFSSSPFQISSSNKNYSYFTIFKTQGISMFCQAIHDYLQSIISDVFGNPS